MQKILVVSKQEKITYVGFSQGSATGFACFSSFPQLKNKINLFIALAPCVYLKGFSNPVAHSVAETRPHFSFLIFGKKIFMGNNMFWRKILSASSWVKLMEVANNLLFGWTMKKFDSSEREMLYSHLYSTTSVKSVIHWFQILHHSKFLMYDSSLSKKSIEYGDFEMPVYDIQHFTVPTALLCGKSDTLPDNEKLLSVLPSKCIIHHEEFEGYEHLDLMWAKDTSTVVIPVIKNLLNKIEKNN